MTNKKTLILLIGAPGAGKGTQAKYILSNHDFGYLAVGDILRSRQENDPVLKQKLSSGALLDSNYINQLVDEELTSATQSVILLDGYPRKLDQALYLQDKYNVYPIYLKITSKDVMNRLLKRKYCKNCGLLMSENDICDACKSSEVIYRSDDNEQTIEKRLSEFHKNNENIINFYANQIYIVDAVGEPLEIYEQQIKPFITELLQRCENAEKYNQFN